MERDVRARPGLHGLSLSMVITGLLCAAILIMPSLARADALPDGRAYELVSPGLQGADVFDTDQLYTQASADGNEMLFIAHDGTDNGTSSSFYNAFESSRGTAGWAPQSVSVPFALPEQNFIATGIDTFSSSLSQFVVGTDQPLTPDAQPGANLFLGTVGGGYQLLTPVGLTGGNGEFISAVSSDFSHIFYNPQVAQLSNDPVNYASGDTNLYQWANGQLSIVNVMPNGTLSPHGAVIPSNPVPALNGVSADGDAVLFQNTSGAQDPLYLRLDGSSTVNVGLPQRTSGSPGPYEDPTAVGITASGSDVLFTSAMELTQNANTGAAHSEAGNDLYDYNVGTGTLIDLTPDANAADAATGADVQSVIGGDSAADYVYFIADGDLAAGATSGQDNLYVEHGGTITFISPASGITSTGDVAYTTPDGQFIAFESTDSLTGYDNTDQVTGQPDTEVYEYDAASATLSCASCRPDGVAPTGSASIPTGGAGGGDIGASPRVVSDDGSRVFFDSDDAVVPGATDGLQNVYEYEGGSVSLISPGDGQSPATLLDASSTGDDVFFVSYDDLVPPLNASLQSAVWDARVGGGFPVPGVTSGPCTATTQCRGASTAPPTLPTVATVTFSATTGSVRVQRRVVRGSAVSLRVRVGGAGRLTASGRDVATVHRRLHHRATVTLTLRLTPRARAQLAHHSLHLTIHVRFASSMGTRRATVKVTARGGGHR